MRTVDGGLQQRGRNGHARGLLGLVLAGGAADAHVGKACILHNGGHVGKIEVDEARVADQVGDALHRLTQHVVRDLERVGKGDLLVGRVLEALVRDDDERVDLGLELFDACFRLRHAAAAFKTEGLRHDADGQDARLARLISATMGAPPCRCRRPSPAVMKTISVSSSALAIWLRLSSALLRPTSGSEPAP